MYGLVVRVHHVGVQLHQVASGLKGKRLGVGGIIHETEEAIKAEMADAWATMRDEARYSEFKKNIKDLREVIETSCASGLCKAGRDAILKEYLS